MEAFKQWSVGLITLPHNFKAILDKTEKDDQLVQRKLSQGDQEKAREGLVVICVGLSRTGTSSLKAALSQLLPGRTYHAMDLLQDINSHDTFTFWKSLSEDTASTGDIREFFSNRHYSAVCDIPCLQYWRQLAAAFPRARLVLTVREPTAWYRSVSTTLLPLVSQIDRWSWLLRIMCGVLYQSKFQLQLLEILFRQLRCKELQQEASAVRFYHRWNEEVVAAVQPDNLLVFDVREGWEPLCQFLRLDSPAGPFPRLNDSSALVRHQWRVSFIISLFLALVLLVCWLAMTGRPWHVVLLAALAFSLAIVLGLLLWTRLATEQSKPSGRS